MPLTETQIRNLKPASTPKKHFDGEGLFLYVTPAGSKLWRMAYRFEGKEKLLSFGKYPTVSLRDARTRRILQIIGQIFRYAIILGKVKQNPVSELRGALKPHKVVHRASVTSPPKVGQLLRDIDRYEGYFPLICALKLAPLVFTRHTELRAAEWKEFDLSKSE